MSWGKVLFLGVVVAVALSGYAIGAGSQSSNTVVLCAAKKSGAVTLGNGGKCGKGEKKISIAKEGPRGLTGPVGAVGPPGPEGKQGPPGTPPPLEAVHFVSPANTACAIQTGSFCVTESGLCYDMANAGNGQEPVSFRKDSDGYVHLEGAYVNTNGQGACGSELRPVFFLPQGFRPSGGSLRFPAAPCSGQSFEAEYGNGFITILPNGKVAGGSTSTGCLTFDGVVFHGDA